MKVPVFEAIAGTTVRLTMVNSGVTPTDISCALLDKDEVLVSSMTAVSSGNGHYYAPVYVPSSWPWYVAQWIQTIDARTYVSRGLVKRNKLEAN